MDGSHGFTRENINQAPRSLKAFEYFLLVWNMYRHGFYYLYFIKPLSRFIMLCLCIKVLVFK